MNNELAWLMVPWVGFLSQLGGTYNKLYRRLGVPSVITAFAALLCGFSPWTPVLFIAIFATTTLPFTFWGDDLKDHWFNWIFIWIAGYLLGLPSLILHNDGWIYAFVPCVIQGVCGTLSNVRKTAKYFQWKFFEFIVWSGMAYCYALAITLR